MIFTQLQNISKRMKSGSMGPLNSAKLHLAFFLFVVGMIATGFSNPVLAGGGHAHGPSGEPVVRSNTVEINDTTAENIGLAVQEVDRRQIFDVIRTWGRFSVKPTDIRMVSSRVQGQIVELNVEKGDRVEAGQGLVIVESLRMGNPPPRATYRAPVDGIVSTIDVSPGEGVRANQRLLSVTAPDDLRIEAQVHERNLDRVKQNTQARVIPGSKTSESWPASVEHIDHHVDERSGYGTVWLKPEKTDGFVPYFGKQVSVDLLTGSAEIHPVVPRSAVLGTSGNHFVFVQSPDNPLRFIKRRVVLGPSNGQLMAIKDGLQPGDTVAIRGSYQLQYASSVEGDDSGTGSDQDQGNHGHDHNQQSKPHDNEDPPPQNKASGHGHDHKQQQTDDHGHDHGAGEDH